MVAATLLGLTALGSGVLGMLLDGTTGRLGAGIAFGVAAAILAGTLLGLALAVVSRRTGRPAALARALRELDGGELSRAGRDLTRVIEAAPNGVLTVDAEGRIATANRELERILGYEPGELVGEPVECLVPRSERPTHASWRRGYLARPATRRMGTGRDLTALRKDGSEVPVEIGLSTVETSGGVMVLVAVTDISERVRLRRREAAVERRFRVLYERTPLMLHSLDRSGRIREVSDYWLDALGYDRESVVGRDLCELMTPESAEVVRARGWPTLHQTGTLRAMPCTVRRNDGTSIDVELSAVHQEGDDPDLDGSIGFMLDVSARLRSERLLRANEIRLRSFLEHLQHGVAYFDADDRLVYCNGEYARLNADLAVHLQPGVRFETLVRASARRRVAAGNAQSVDAYVADRLERHRNPGEMIERRRLDGGAHLIRETRTPDGGTMVSFVDVTEIRLRERELERSNADLEQFAYAASHDLQQPLRAISGYVQLLARRYRGRLDDDADTFIDFAVQGAQRMQQLIDDLLRYSRVGADTRREPVDPAAALDEALDDLRVAIEESGARIVVGPLPPVLADRTRLRHVFQNLIGNSLKFRSEHPPDIRIDAVELGSTVEIRVCDNGIGIAPEHRERVFAVFQRLHSASEYPGTGIGLALCKRIIEGFGGRIWAAAPPATEAGPAFGVCFHFALASARQPHEQDDAT
ncbi:MAG: PAS domain S-box protein [Ectothiorhodospiraceae bacterium]|nr:PAS domain S-box protein [Chromatiales bacterium]MCP5154397.1 PAS domain S-box protein [Ectothiorhodospiraceae bacterium]